MIKHKFLNLAFVAIGVTLVGGRSSAAPLHDVVIEGGMIYDGTGRPPYLGDVVIDGEKISYVGTHKGAKGRRVIDAHGQAVSPGFINMLSGADSSLWVDGRGESDVAQGVTLEVAGEGTSMGPLSDAMAARNEKRAGNRAAPITWRNFSDYFGALERKGISPNIASMVGASTVRDYVLGEADVQPTADQLKQMQSLVRQAMTEGALGVSSALIYAPGTFAKTPELKALATEAGKCGGIYITHMRSEGDTLREAVDETIDIAKASGAPAEIYHLKAVGKANWPKIDDVIEQIKTARASGVRISADMYPYTAASTGLDASMPHWVLDGGLEAWIARMKDPATRSRLLAEMQSPNPEFESGLIAAGPEGTLLLGFRTEALKALSGKTLAEVAKMRGKSPEETAIDLIIEDGTRIGVAYEVMSENNLRKEVVLPWMSFNSDAGAITPEGAVLRSVQHPRGYGTFARVLAKYVREEKLVSLADAIHRLSGLPAANLSLKERGLLKVGNFADVVVFDPAVIQDHSTFEAPHQLATGVHYVLVNGGLALDDGKFTGTHTGRFIHGQGWSGWKDGGCRSSAKDWHWSK